MGNIHAKFRPMLDRVKQALAEAEGIRLGSTDTSSMTAYSGRMSELSGSGMTGTAYGDTGRSPVAGKACHHHCFGVCEDIIFSEGASFHMWKIVQDR
jgi:hypothetical protein